MSVDWDYVVSAVPVFLIGFGVGMMVCFRFVWEDAFIQSEGKWQRFCSRCVRCWGAVLDREREDVLNDCAVQCRDCSEGQARRLSEGLE